MAYNFAGPRLGVKPAPLAEEAPAMPDKAQALTAYFGFERSELSPVAAGAVRQAATDAASGRKSVIRIAGPASRSDGVAEGDVLSLRRADAVRNELLRQGVAPDRIATVCARAGLPSETLIAIAY